MALGTLGLPQLIAIFVLALFIWTYHRHPQP
jgi:hypothetical protein